MGVASLPHLLKGHPMRHIYEVHSNQILTSYSALRPRRAHTTRHADAEQARELAEQRLEQERSGELERKQLQAQASQIQLELLSLEQQMRTWRIDTSALANVTTRPLPSEMDALVTWIEQASILQRVAQEHLSVEIHEMRRRQAERLAAEQVVAVERRRQERLELQRQEIERRRREQIRKETVSRQETELVVEFEELLRSNPSWETADYESFNLCSLSVDLETEHLRKRVSTLRKQFSSYKRLLEEREDIAQREELVRSSSPAQRYASYGHRCHKKTRRGNDRRRQWRREVLRLEA